MKTVTVSEFKAQFSQMIEHIKSGEEIAVTFGKKKEAVGFFVPASIKGKKQRPLGLLKGKVKVVFADDFKITGKQFLGL